MGLQGYHTLAGVWGRAPDMIKRRKEFSAREMISPVPLEGENYRAVILKGMTSPLWYSYVLRLKACYPCFLRVLRGVLKARQ